MTDRAYVLLVEDALDMQLMVQASIGQACKLICAGCVHEAYAALQSQTFSLLILDVNLPDGDGFEFCKTLHAEPNFQNLPIIFLTGEHQIDSRVLGFDLGADDYIVKPFEPNEFKARVLARLKRKQIAHAQTSFTQGNFRVDWHSQKAFLETDDVNHELALTPIEFKLLVHFLRNENQIFSRQELLTAVWGTDVYVSGHTVDTHISSLRKKVGAQARHFRAVVRKGYCFSRTGKHNM